MRTLKMAALAAAFGATLLAAAPAQAQRQMPSQEELKSRFDKKMAKDFWKNGAWVTSYDEALKQSKETGKKIFAYFTRSYSP